MVEPSQFVFQAAGEGEQVSWRAQVLVKAGQGETGGAFSLLETTTAPDGGPPLHLHHSVDEAFYVLAGGYEFFCGDRRVEAGPGAFVLLPRGVPHRYRSGSDGGRMLMLFTPGGAEAYFREIAAAMADGDVGGEVLVLDRRREAVPGCILPAGSERCGQVG